MAQTTEWLLAIWNYMKKVKSNISTVPPAHPGGKVTATQKADVGGSIVVVF